MDEILEAEKKFQDSNVTHGVRSDYFVYYEYNTEVAVYLANILESVSGKLLILGCGDVDITSFSKYNFNQIFGIDISPESIKKVNLNIKEKMMDDRIKVSVMDAHHLEFEDQSFDAVFGTGILHHLDLSKATKEISRVLKPNGKMIFMEPLGLNPFINWFRNRTPQARTEYEHPLKVSDFRIFKRYFEIDTKGFYLLSILSFGFKTFIKSDLLFRLSRSVLLKLDRLLLAIFPLKYFCWIVVIEGTKSSR